jgi:hypothetical protein
MWRELSRPSRIVRLGVELVDVQADPLEVRIKAAGLVSLVADLRLSEPRKAA